MISIRLHGMKWIVAAIGICAAVVGIILLIERMGFVPGPIAMVGLAIPFVPLFGGIIEVITGIPFFELARRWDNLKGWQRGLYGTTFVVLALFGILAIVGGYFTFLDHIGK